MSRPDPRYHMIRLLAIGEDGSVPLRITVSGDDRLRVEAGAIDVTLRGRAARRHHVIDCGSVVHPVTTVVGTSSGGGGEVRITVDCGATPPTFVLCGPGGGRVALSIDHHQQESILDVLEAYLHGVGIGPLPARCPSRRWRRVAA